ncbi:MAG: hypothetical protein ACT4O1_13855 [Gemmatimonadota bacterium]
MNAPSWLTGRADAASLASLIEKLGTQIDVATVDELFVFPMRRVAGVESTVFVLSIHDPDEKRRVITAHVRATRNKRGEPAIETKLDEQAIIPAERIPRVIEGVLKRLSDDFATPPSVARIAGSRERWTELGQVLMSIKANEPLPENLLSATERRDGDALQ